MSLTRIHAREVLDSRGHPTVEVEAHCASGAWGCAIVPAGASTGAAEAHELRDGDASRYSGRGVRRAVANVNDVIGPAVVGMDPADQFAVDARLLELDATPQKKQLGGNAILGVSLAVAHAAAASEGIALYRHINRLWNDPRLQVSNNRADHLPKRAAQPPVLPFATSRASAMPLPMTNMISGGLHAGGNLDFQDFLLVPVGARDYATGLEWLVRVAHRLGDVLTAAGYEGRLLADEGGYGPRLASSREALDMLLAAIGAANLSPGTDLAIALDVASTHFFRDGRYQLSASGAQKLTSADMIDQLESLVTDYPIISIEDGLAEEDWHGWQQLTERLGRRIRLVGDDLFATNVERLGKGISFGAGNSVLVKVNQIGTLSEALATMQLAAAAGYTRVVSARSGETEDTTIADLAVGTAAEMIKIGSVQRGERLAKYNRLLRIEEELGRG